MLLDASCIHLITEDVHLRVSSSISSLSSSFHFSLDNHDITHSKMQFPTIVLRSIKIGKCGNHNPIGINIPHIRILALFNSHFILLWFQGRTFPPNANSIAKTPRLRKGHFELFSIYFFNMDVN